MYRFVAYGTEIVPKPVRLYRGKKYSQSKQAIRYLNNQELWIRYIQNDMLHKRQEMFQEFPLPPPLSLGFVYHMLHNRRIDRTNIEKAIEDALVKAGVIEDDNVHVVPDSHRIVTRQGAKDYWLMIELKTIDNLYDEVIKRNQKGD